MSVPGAGWARWRSPLGYPVGILCIWLARPTLRLVLIGVAVALVGLLIRASAAGHLRKRQALACTGPYARTRNPLYLGSSFLALGFAICSGSWIVVALLAAYFGTFYPMVIRREQDELRAQYGQAYDDYVARVPVFLPRLRVDGDEGRTEFSLAQYLRNREYQAAVGVVVLVALLSAMAVWRK